MSQLLEGYISQNPHTVQLRLQISLHKKAIFAYLLVTYLGSTRNIFLLGRRTLRATFRGTALGLYIPFFWSESLWFSKLNCLEPLIIPDNEVLDASQQANDPVPMDITDIVDSNDEDFPATPATSSDRMVWTELQSEPSLAVHSGCQTLSKQSLTLLYAHSPSPVLERNLDAVSEVLECLGDEVDIMMGFDVYPTEASLANDDDIDFFTGIPQTLNIRLTYHSETANCLDRTP